MTSNSFITGLRGAAVPETDSRGMSSYVHGVEEVQATELVLPLNVLGNVGDGQRRCIAGQDCVSKTRILSHEMKGIRED